MTPIFGIGPKFPIFKTLQITKDWGWNEDNEQDWVPKNGGLLTQEGVKTIIKRLKSKLREAIEDKHQIEELIIFQESCE